MNKPQFIPEITDAYVQMHETHLVPAIYAQWAHWITDLAKIDGPRPAGVSCVDVFLGCRAQ